MNTTQLCPTCEWAWPTELMVPVHIDIMGDPNTTMNVCPDCARHALPNTETENN